jgi:hypothetical protein
MSSLKEGLIGTRRQMRVGKPDVFITINELLLQDDGDFSAAQFSLKDLKVRCSVEVIGSNFEIVQELGSELALKLVDKVRMSSMPSTGRDSKNSELLGAREAATSPTSKAKILGDQAHSIIQMKERDAPVADRISGGTGDWDKTKETKAFDVEAVMDMCREIGDMQVAVEVRNIEAMGGKGKREPVRNKSFAKYLKDALSQRLTEILIDKEEKPKK